MIFLATWTHLSLVITRQICSQSDPISGPSLAWHVGHDAVMLSLWHDDMTTWQSETLLWTDNIQWLSHRELPGPGCHCTHCTLGKHGPRVGQINQSTRSLGQIKQSHLNWNIIWQINIPLLLTELSLNPTLHCQWSALETPGTRHWSVHYDHNPGPGLLHNPFITS